MLLQPFRSVSPDSSLKGEECLTTHTGRASLPHARSLSQSNAQTPADEEVAQFMPDVRGYFENSILLSDSTMETHSRQPLQMSQPLTPPQPGHQSQSSKENLQKVKNPFSLIFPDSEHPMFEATSADIDRNGDNAELSMPPLLTENSLSNTHEDSPGAIQSDYFQAANRRDPVDETASPNSTSQTLPSSHSFTSMEDDHSLTPDRDKDNDRHRRYLGKTFKSQKESKSDPRHEDGPSSEEGDTLFHTETVYVFKDGAWREMSTTQIIWDLALKSFTPEVTKSS